MLTPDSSGKDLPGRLAGLVILAVAGIALARAGEPAPSPAPSAPPATASAAAGAPAAAPVAESPPAPISRVDLQASFRREFEAKHYEAAATLARQYVELTEKEVGTQGEDLQVGLMNLATSQYLAGDYVDAEASYLRAIELAEASARPRIERLARANAGLAATYYAGRRYDLAVARFQRAVSLNRRSEGLLSESQLPLLDKFANALTELGRYQEAVQIQQYSLRIAQRKYGEGDPRTAPTLEKIGRWYSKVGAYEQAQSVLRRTIDIVAKAEGDDSPNLIGPLTALADCARRQLTDPAQLARATPDAANSSFYQDPNQPPPFSPTQTANIGQRALDRAVTLATTRKDPQPAQIADVRTQYGDWFQVRGQSERAMEQYLEAWKAGQQVKFEGKTLSEALFAAPVLLHYSRPSGWDRYSTRPASEITLKVVVLSATVTPDGHAADPRIVDGGDDERRAELARKALLTATYRPRFENGQPAATTGVQFTQVFQVLLPKEEPKDEPKGEAPAAPAAPETGKDAAPPAAKAPGT